MMLGDTNNRFSASRAVVVLASGLMVGLFLVALLSQKLARIDALDALTQMRLAATLQNLIMFMLPAVAVGTLCGGGNPLRFLRLDKAPSAMAVAGIVLISLAMTPAMNWLVAWNASLSLPEAMKPVEQWMRAQENAALREALLQLGFLPIPSGDGVYCVDMRAPVMLLQDVMLTIKQPHHDDPAVKAAPSASTIRSRPEARWRTSLAGDAGAAASARGAGADVPRKAPAVLRFRASQSVAHGARAAHRRRG